MHISSSDAKILGETNFRTREIPRSGSKAKDRERKRLNDGSNNGQAMHGARKHAWRTQAAWAKISLEMAVPGVRKTNVFLQPCLWSTLIYNFILLFRPRSAQIDAQLLITFSHIDWAVSDPNFLVTNFFFGPNCFPLPISFSN